jgi:hypothetical protein
VLLTTSFGPVLRVDGRLIRIARLAGDGFQFPDNPSRLVEYLSVCGKRLDLFTFTQRPFERQLELPYLAETENWAILPVSTFDHWWHDQINNKTRNMVRHAERKGVMVRTTPFDDDLVRGIWTIYNECPVRQGRPFSHYGRTMEDVRRISATFPQDSLFIGAFLDGGLIGFAKLVFDDRNTQAGLMHIVSMVQHRDKAPTNALIAHAVSLCAERGTPSLVYARLSYGNKKQDSVAAFKERNGFRSVGVIRCYVPLTPAGRVAFRLGLHRNPIDQLPEALTSWLRQARAVWYRAVVARSLEHLSHRS